MSKVFITFSIIVVSISLISWINNSENLQLNKKAVPGLADSVKAELNYKNYCASCHGEKMDMFVDRKWKHGNSAEDLYKGIKVGYPDEGMPGFDSAFNDQEIKDLSDYMLKGISNFKRYEFKGAPQENYFPATAYNIRLDTIASGMHIPWSVAFLPDGQYLVTDRNGDLFKVAKDGTKTKISGVPQVLYKGQGGLFDVVLHPNFKKNRQLYISYAGSRDSSGITMATTIIIRAELKGDKLRKIKRIFEAWPYARTQHHYGGRMVFDKDGYLFFSVGERGNEKQNPQYLGNDLGKIHRIKDDGSVPADNPFIKTPGARSTIYTYGNRNPQGLALNETTGEIWENEHGPRGGDEINLIKKGKNYGWPLITYGINYNGKPISSKTSDEGMEQPIRYYIPSIGPSGMTFVTGNKYTLWNGSILNGSLRFKYLDRTSMSGTKPTGEEMLVKNIGRLRDVRQGPDGYIYIAVEEPGYIFRLMPEEK